MLSGDEVGNSMTDMDEARELYNRYAVNWDEDRPQDVATCFTPDAVFQKHSHSALIGSGLDVWLTQHGVRRVIVCGIRSEQCCETTTRHASDLGYQVDYVTDATLTFPMTDRHGKEWTPEEIKARTELVLDGRFARIATVEEALATPCHNL